MQRWIGRALLVFFAALFAISAWPLVNNEGVSDRPTLASASPTTSASSPATIAPPVSIAPAPVATTTPRPLGEVPVTSGRPKDVAVPEVRLPVRLHIDELSIGAPIVPVGYDPSRNEMEVPESAATAGWYQFSAVPGEGGSSVVAAHVDWNGRPGAFFDLYQATAGMRITIEFEDGTTSEFEVVATEQYEKKALPTDAIFDRSGEPVLTLITCGGVFNESVRSYEDNVVVYATPLSDSHTVG